VVYNGRREAIALDDWHTAAGRAGTPSGGSGRMKRRRSRRPFVRARGTRYAQWIVLIVAAALLGRLAWQGYRVLRPLSRQDAVQSAPAPANPLPVQDPWQRDVLESIESGMLSAQSGNITAAEVAADRASSIVTTARLQSQAAAPDFFVLATDGLDRVMQQHPENERLLGHVTDARVELAQLRTWQNHSIDDPRDGVSGDDAAGTPAQIDEQRSASGTGSERKAPGHVSIGAPREIGTNATLDPKSLGGNYLDATLMPDSSEILLPPSTRLATDNVRVENLTIAGAAQTLDNVHWRNVTFIGTRLRFESGVIDLENVHFVRCTFGFPSDARGARLANAIALGQTSITIE
jgi:hypothetical protein